jgi:hypothetical protein
MTPLGRHRDWRGCIAVLRDAREVAPAAVPELEAVVRGAEAALWDGGEVGHVRCSVERRARLLRVSRRRFWEDLDYELAVELDLEPAEVIEEHFARWAAERRREFKRRSPVDWLAWDNSGAAARRPWARPPGPFGGVDRTAASDVADALAYGWLHMQERHPGNVTAQVLSDVARRHLEPRHAVMGPQSYERLREALARTAGSTSPSGRHGRIAAASLRRAAFEAGLRVVSDPACPSMRGLVPARDRADLFNDGRSWTTTLTPTTSQGDDHADR